MLAPIPLRCVPDLQEYFKRLEKDQTDPPPAFNLLNRGRL
jgi:hypothetical protein